MNDLQMCFALCITLRLLTNLQHWGAHKNEIIGQVRRWCMSKHMVLQEEDVLVQGSKSLLMSASTAKSAASQATRPSAHSVKMVLQL